MSYPACTIPRVGMGTEEVGKPFKAFRAELDAEVALGWQLFIYMPCLDIIESIT